MQSIWADDEANGPTEAEPTATGGGGGASASPSGSDPEPEDEPEPFQLPRAERERRPQGLRTVGEAYELCERLIHDQLRLALERRPDANASLPGDAASRAAFLLLLPDSLQRRLFLQTARNPGAWPRIRTLFGAPPFHFLLPEDGGMLRAAGFARGRTNMAYETAGRGASVAQFGPGQFVDNALREYRVVPREASVADPLPGEEYFLSVGAGEVVLQVKVPKRSPREKQQLMGSINKQQLFFPQAGERIELRESARMLSAKGLRQPSRTHLVVKALAPRGQGAQTATLLVKVG